MSTKEVKKVFFLENYNPSVKYNGEIVSLNPAVSYYLYKKNIKYHIVGIRPGEKLHEVLCPEDSARDTLEFKNYYLIRPSSYHADSIKDKNNSYKINKNNEKGKFVKSNFVYDSSINSHFLSVKELKKFI